MPVRAALFDFDGTLADSFAAITASTNHVRTRYGLPPVPEATVREYVGLGLANLMEELVPTAPTAEAVAAYREHHPTVMLTHTTLFPGVADTLAVLRRRGLRTAVCSNKAVHFTKQLVAALGLADVFDEVLGPEDVGRPKPDPAMLLEAVRRLGVAKDEAVYVGDMAVDVHTAKAAGIAVWLVPGGAAGRESPTAAGPDRVLGTFADLAGLL
jgi:phosphoglycolate phosphatase